MTIRRLNGSDPDWTVREHINEQTGDHTNTYYYKRRKCLKFKLNSNLAKQLAGYTLIEKDLRNVAVWLGEILPYLEVLDNAIYQKSPDRTKFNIVKGLFVASLNFYGKCFTQCEGRRVKLDKKIIKDDSLKQEHEEIMSMRHNFAAHSGKDSSELVQISLVLDSKKERNTYPNLVREMKQPDSTSSDDIKKFIKLVEYLREHTLRKMKVVQDKILEEEVFMRGKNYWYTKAKKI